MAALMYGAGLRVNECCHLRVQDIDFAARTVRVHSGKGDKSRLTVLPMVLAPLLKTHFAWRKSVHDLDLQNGFGFVELPGRLAVKYKNANRELRWQWLFPSTVIRGQYRWHVTDEMIAKQMRAAVRAAGITKRVTPHTLRHGFVTHALEAGNDLAVVQKLVGHEDVNTTMIYAHGDRARGFSPLDFGARAMPAMEPAMQNLIAP
jgi:site-specific recombinase XerD